MKKILMVATIPATLEGFLLPFASYFRAQGWQVDAMANGISNSEVCCEIFDQRWEVEWSRNPLDFRNLFIAPQKIQEVVRQGKYDIVHVHTPVAAFVTRYALRNKNLFSPQPQIIYTAHGFHFYQGGKKLKNNIFLNLEKLAGNWTDYLVVINREDEEAAKKYKLISSERIRYMPGIGVDLQYYNPDVISQTEIHKVRQELGLNTDSQILLSVSELIPRKRPQDIIKAFARQDISHACLVFAGDGPLLNEMQQLAKNLNVENQVSFLGFRKDIPTLMSAATATILASEQEGLPRCVMESMSLGTPVIGTSIRGTRDLLKDGCGFLVEVGNIEKLSEAISDLLTNPQKAYFVGQRGRDRISNYSLESIICLHSDLYNEAIASKDSLKYSIAC